MVKKFLRSSLFPPSVVIVILIIIYYQFFIFGKIPFPGDLLVASYSPWFDYNKMPVKNPLISDVFSQFILWKYLSIDSLKNLEWPLWDPYSFTGNPLLATYHSSTLYPPNIILFLPKYAGWGLFIFSQTLFAAINFYLLLTLWVKSISAKITGSIIFSLGGLMTTWVEMGTAVHAIAWLPLALYSIEKFIRTLKFRYLTLLIISLSLLLLAGNAQVTTYSFAITFFFALVKSLNKNLKIFVRLFLPLCLSFVLIILLSSLQILPTLDLFNKSIRLTESYTGEYNFGLLPLKDILKFFVADFFGNSTTYNYWGG